ncbi:MAG: hypothetical protein QNJ44_17280 [Rhodobacter sp.]|nr:hypothetical protein [Rhodobacter sp.]
MTTQPKTYSFRRGLKVTGKGIVAMARTNLLVIVWVNFFATWFVGGGVLMLMLGSTSILPLLCLLTPIVALTWLFFLTSKFGFSRILGMPRAVPWLVPMAVAIHEFATGTYAGQPDGYYVFLVGFLVINGIATAIDFVDIYRWLAGERAEQFNTGFFDSREDT